MNVILILIDSLVRHHLPAYNPDSPVPTPNLDRLASKAFRFDNHFVGSLPCMPARREIFAGRKEFLWRSWGPLEQFDERLLKLLEQNGYSTNIVTAHYLFDRAEDPTQERDLWDERPEEHARMLDPARDLISAGGAPSEQYERLGLQVRRCW